MSLTIALANDPSPVRDCCIGRHVRFGLPPATLEPFLHYSEGVWSGLMYGLIDAVVREMGMTHTLIPDRYVLLDPGATSPLLLGANSTIDFSAVRTTNEKAWHHDQAASVVRTTSIFNSYYSGVQYRTSSDSGMFGLFQPFSDSLWLALFITMACAGLVMAFLADLSAGSGRRLQLRSDGTIAGAIKDLRSATHTQWPDVASSGASGATWLLMQIWHYVLAIPEGFYQSFSAMVGGVEYGASDWASKEGSARSTIHSAHHPRFTAIPGTMSQSCGRARCVFAGAASRPPHFCPRRLRHVHRQPRVHLH
mmetsp:Transcript_48972/g.135842  ORF Transcript_48972/g.135842 Transcript_48972/m.135842 type:complete len:308 (-) Transcript_48972:965-1888(-)